MDQFEKFCLYAMVTFILLSVGPCSHNAITQQEMQASLDRIEARLGMVDNGN
jgi:hypothetical protein